jgi:hypothetical protein
MAYSQPPIASTDDEQKILRALMLRDRAVLRRRQSLDQYPPEVRAAIRAARTRQAKQNLRHKSNRAIVSPVAKPRRTAHG